MDDKVYRCGCGAWTGQRCPWVGPESGMVVVETMPEHLRASHEAAGNSGVYPHNGAIRVAVERSCAEELLADEAERDWSWVVDLPPYRYTDYRYAGD